MFESTFDYDGHTVTIASFKGKKNLTEYWVHIDGRAIFQVSQLSTAKRLATRFIDVIAGSQFVTSRQGKTTQPATH